MWTFHILSPSTWGHWESLGLLPGWHSGIMTVYHNRAWFLDHKHFKGIGILCVEKYIRFYRFNVLNSFHHCWYGLPKKPRPVLFMPLSLLFLLSGIPFPHSFPGLIFSKPQFRHHFLREAFPQHLTHVSHLSASAILISALGDQGFSPLCVP